MGELKTVGFIFLALLVGWLAYRAKKLGYFDGKKEVAIPSAPLFPCVIEGNIDMPPMADVIKAARIDVEAAKGYLSSVGKYRPDLSDQECMALCSTPVKGQPGWDGVNKFGGGGAYGGRYMTGSFHFEIDAIGQRIDKASWVKLFSDTPYPVTGGVRGDGGIGMGSIGGTNIIGRISDGKLLDARIEHGDGKVHIYGVLNGTWRPL